jgi:hypothetical protein
MGASGGTGPLRNKCKRDGEARKLYLGLRCNIVRQEPAGLPGAPGQHEEGWEGR